MLARSRRRLFWPLLLPALGLYIVLFVYPVLNTVQISITAWAGVFIDSSFVGAAQYARATADSFFHRALWNTLLYVVIGGSILFPAALIMAWGLHLRIRGFRVFRFVVFAPTVLSVVVAAILWRFLYDPGFGLFNGLLGMAGAPTSFPWLGDTRTALLAITITIVWHGIGTFVIIMLAGLDRIPQDLTDAALVDGASELRTFRHVTLPLFWPVLRILLIYWVIQSFQSFAFVFIMTRGGPLRSTEMASTYIFKLAFEASQFAYAAALSVVLMVVILAASYLATRITRAESYEY